MSPSHPVFCYCDMTLSSAHMLDPARHYQGTHVPRGWLWAGHTWTRLHSHAHGYATFCKAPAGGAAARCPLLTLISRLYLISLQAPVAPNIWEEVWKQGLCRFHFSVFGVGSGDQPTIRALKYQLNEQVRSGTLTCYLCQF